MNIKVSMFHVLGRRRIWLPGRLLAGTILLVPLVIAAALPMDFLPFDPFESVAEPFSAPSFEHPFGVDDLGRDLFSAALAGSQTSLTMGLAVAGLAMFIGVTIGVIAGFFGGYLDDVLMRLTELVQSVPRFFYCDPNGCVFWRFVHHIGFGSGAYVLARTCTDHACRGTIAEKPRICDRILRLRRRIILGSHSPCSPTCPPAGDGRRRPHYHQCDPHRGRPQLSWHL